jgi:hypothetical protein
MFMTKDDFAKKVKEAKEELGKKSYRDIQVETAWKWAARACASYENVLTADRHQKFQIYLLAQEYEHEAVEHAALVPTNADDLLERVQELLSQYHVDAWDEMVLVFDL